MNKLLVTSIQDFIERNSRYRELLHERYTNEQRYARNLEAIKQGINYLGIPPEAIKVFQERTSLILRLGESPDHYHGYELPLYIAYHKQNLPIPEEITAKCDPRITSLIDRTTRRLHINEYQEELRAVSFSVDIFLLVHKSMIGARLESLLPDLLSDLERLAVTNIPDAVKKIPPIYLNYLSPESFSKLIKKIASGLREIKNKMDEELKNIDLYSIRMREQLQELYLETIEGLKAIVDNEVEKGADINIITQKVSNLFSRLDRLFLGNIYHLQDYQRRKREIQQFLRQEDESRYTGDTQILDKRRKLGELYEDYVFFDKFGPLNREEDKIFSRILLQEFEQLFKQKSQDLNLLRKFEKKALLSVQLEFEAIKEVYYNFVKQVIIPEHIGTCLYDLVGYLPPGEDEPKKVIHDTANLCILACTGKSILNPIHELRDHPKHLIDYVEAFRKCITVLIYDIRGSSYMGIKLHNAVKEQKIKYKFAKEMAKIVKKYDGFPLKDTGDGGLVWFSENSGSLYKHLYTESVTGRGMKLRHSIFSGAGFNLIPAFDAAKRAILCARDMILRAEEFIRANFMHYREWFADVAERTLELDGITYALLPPEFKSLFRIGIGIASGLPDRDVVLAANSYGDPDLVGPILSDAHLYSMERQPGRSVTICDLATVINMIFNTESFEYEIDEADFDKYIQLVEDLRKKNHGYRFLDHKVSLVPKGTQILEELDKKRALSNEWIEELLIDSNSNLYNQHNKRIKLLYEVLNIE